MKKAKFNFIFDTADEANIVTRSLDPEIKQKIPKTNVKIKPSEKTVFLEIESDDISALRAAVNSYLRWINTAINVKKIV
jgi:KEOPS complex subunit Pcc1